MWMLFPAACSLSTPPFPHPSAPEIFWISVYSSVIPGACTKTSVRFSPAPGLKCNYIPFSFLIHFHGMNNWPHGVAYNIFFWVTRKMLSVFPQCLRAILKERMNWRVDGGKKHITQSNQGRSDCNCPKPVLSGCHVITFPLSFSKNYNLEMNAHVT